jgi:prepilin-type N-terminal cleavage/methylation domain-containing protein
MKRTEQGFTIMEVIVSILALAGVVGVVYMLYLIALALKKYIAS